MKKCICKKDGLSMGSSISGFLADVFINNLETKFFYQFPNLVNKIVYYYRYVDDTLLLIKGRTGDVDEIVNGFKGLHKKIVFTVEIGNKGSINFFDLTISNDNGRHAFGIFRKPTSTDAIVDYNSNHHSSHKKAFFHFAFNRMFRLPLKTTDREFELKLIKQIAKKNNYPIEYVMKIYNRVAHKYKENKSNAQNKVEKSKKYVTLPYYGKISTRIASVFTKQNIVVSFTNENSIGRLLVTNINKHNKLYESGVYKHSCTDFSAFYVGQTRRRLQVRYRERVAIDRKDIVA